MNVIWKFELSPGETTIHTPGNWKPLHVDKQGESVCLWALVEPDKPMTNKTFVTISIGEPFHSFDLEYIGTVTGLSEWLVFHVFQIED